MVTNTTVHDVGGEVLARSSFDHATVRSTEQMTPLVTTPKIRQKFEVAVVFVVA